ncbi:MAG: CotH kinase family protein, partial [Thermoplasmata archaeon]
TEFQSIILRNAGQDWYWTLFSDALMQSLTKDIDVDTQAYRPAIVFLNGEYWGIYSIREKVNKHYLVTHYGVDPDNIDLLEPTTLYIPQQGRGEPAIEGDFEEYNALLNYIKNHDMSVSANYDYVKTQVDINNFINHKVVQIYVANDDWPGNNEKLWRPRKAGGKWRWITFDADTGFKLYDHNTLEWATTPGSYPHPDWSVFLLSALLQNQNFRNEFINRFADFSNTIFRQEVITQRINEMKEELEPEMPRHLARWKDSIGTMDNWYKNISVMSTFAQRRWSYIYSQNLRGYIIKYFNLTNGKTTISLNVSEQGVGKIKINSIVINEFPWNGIYFPDVPVHITAQPNPGYRFSIWSGITPADSVSIVTSLNGDISVTTHFEPSSSTQYPIVINEINYRSSDSVNPEDWVEFYNPSEDPVDLSRWVFKDEDDTHVYIIPQNTVIGAHDYLVLCRNASLFHEVFPEVTVYLGDFGFGLSGTGELIRLFNDQGVLVDSLTYDDNPPWPEEPDGTGLTLSLRNPVLDNALPGNWSASSPHGTPGEKNDVFIVGVDDLDESSIPGIFILGQNYPNPFNQITTIPFYASEDSRVTLEIYSILGQRVAKILDEYLPSGYHTITFRANDLAGGLYLYTVKAENFLKTKQMVYVK